MMLSNHWFECHETVTQKGAYSQHTLAFLVVTQTEGFWIKQIFSIQFELKLVAGKTKDIYFWVMRETSTRNFG